MKKSGASDSSNEITRRQWILRLGETAVLAGISGLASEASTFLLASGQEYSALPPGLYLPSADNLVHVLGKHNTVAAPAGTETDYVGRDSWTGKPQFFMPDEFGIVSRMTEILLGNVSPEALLQSTHWIDLSMRSAEELREAARHIDPLHRVLAVEYYGEAAVREVETSDIAMVAREGIAQLQKLCNQEYRRGFLELEAPEQLQMIRGMTTSPEDSALRKFVTLIRGEAIRGYYTSMDGIKELDYKGNAYYPSCPGCEAIQGDTRLGG